MLESTEQKEQKKSTPTTKEENNNNGTSYANLRIAFPHEQYFATDVLLRFSTTVLGRSNSNCARQ